MTLKRELIRKIKAMKKDNVPLSPAECDELILLLGGTVRPPHRPKKENRPYNFAAVGGVFFGYLENAETVKEYEDDLRELSSADFQEKAFARITAKNRAEVELSIRENISKEIMWRKNLVDQLRPRSTRKLTEAHKMTAKYFTELGHPMNEKQVSNLIKDLKEGAGFGKGQKFGLNEWRKLMAEENARCQRSIAKMQNEN